MLRCWHGNTARSSFYARNALATSYYFLYYTAFCRCFILILASAIAAIIWISTKKKKPYILGIRKRRFESCSRLAQHSFRRHFTYSFSPFACFYLYIHIEYDFSCTAFARRADTYRHCIMWVFRRGRSFCHFLSIKCRENFVLRPPAFRYFWACIQLFDIDFHSWKKAD